jgi:AraC family transcriptional regulator
MEGCDIIMDILAPINDALDYIEQNLTGPIDLDMAARKAYCSANQFQRMFSYLTGITVHEYIRRRRMTLAALELKITNVKIIDLSIKYNYESADAFSRSFRKLHGVSPSTARMPNIQLSYYPRITISLQILGDSKLKFKIVERESIEFIGKGIMVTMENVGELASKFWNECFFDNSIHNLQSISGGEEVYGVTCYKTDLHNNSWSYHIAYKNNNGVQKCDYEILRIPSLTWVVFETTNTLPEAITDLWTKAYSEWLPYSGYTDLGGPELEVYYSDRCELWISIRKLNQEDKHE